MGSACHQACATVRRAARASATLRQATNQKRLNKRADLYDILAQRLVWLADISRFTRGSAWGRWALLQRLCQQHESR